MKSDLLVVDEISRNFGGHQAVNQVSFSLKSGSIGGLIGPNGAGKTTLFSWLAGSLRPSSGRILLDGRNICGFAPCNVFSAGMARTFQIPRPFAEMSVLDNVMVAAPGQAGESLWNNWLRPKLVARQERQTREEARHWLDFVGLSKLEQRPARILSGGQHKLLELARAMVSKPKLVLLDEPGAGVNPVLLDRIVEKVAALNKEGATFLIIEHNMDLVAALCQPVMVMAQGRLLVSGDAGSVLSDQRVIEAYLGNAA
jgi:branched-chain amino acid transport system ATP-binding protein